MFVSPLSVRLVVAAVFSFFDTVAVAAESVRFGVVVVRFGVTDTSGRFTGATSRCGTSLMEVREPLLAVS